MTFIIPTPQQANAGLRAMKTVLTAAEPLSPTRRTAVEAIQRHLLRTEFDIDALQLIDGAELAAAIASRALREQLVNGMATMALTGDRVEPLELKVIEDFAAALDVHPRSIDQARMLLEERTLLLRFDIARKGPAGAPMRNLYEEKGLWAVVKNVASFAGIVENTEVADRYRSLKDYPEGTLGRALFDFYTSNNFRFPGEKHGAPEALVAHDLTHILGGFGTDIRGETLVIAFQAGYRREDAFSSLVFLLVMLQHGVRLTPFAEPATAMLETPGLIDAMIRSFARGNRMNKDLMDRWSFWADLGRPVDDVRKDYGVEPAHEAS